MDKQIARREGGKGNPFLGWFSNPLRSSDALRNTVPSYLDSQGRIRKQQLLSVVNLGRGWRDSNAALFICDMVFFLQMLEFQTNTNWGNCLGENRVMCCLLVLLTQFHVQSSPVIWPGWFNERPRSEEAREEEPAAADLQYNIWNQEKMLCWCITNHYFHCNIKTLNIVHLPDLMWNSKITMLKWSLLPRFFFLRDF